MPAVMRSGWPTGSAPAAFRSSAVLANSFGTRIRPSSIIALGRWTGRVTVRLVRLLYPPRLARLAWRADTAGYLALVAAAIGAGYVWH
jgi:hypothetical protein